MNNFHSVNDYEYKMHLLYYYIAPTLEDQLKIVNETEDERLKKIIDIININNIDINDVKGWTSLFSFAIFFRQEKIANYLLDKGANTDYIDSIGLTPLNYLCSKPKFSLGGGYEERDNLMKMRSYFNDKEMDKLLIKMLLVNPKLDIFYRKFHNGSYEPHLLYQSGSFEYQKIFDILTEYTKKVYNEPELSSHFAVEINEFEKLNINLRTIINKQKKNKTCLLDYVMAEDEEGAINFLNASDDPKTEIRKKDLDSQLALHWALYMNANSKNEFSMFKLIKLMIEIDCRSVQEDEIPIYAMENVKGLNAIFVAMHFDNFKSHSEKRKVTKLFTMINHIIVNMDLNSNYDTIKIKELNEVFKKYPTLKDHTKNKIEYNKILDFFKNNPIRSKLSIEEYEKNVKYLLASEEEEKQKIEKLSSKKSLANLKKKQKAKLKKEAEIKEKKEAEETKLEEARKKAELKSILKAKKDEELKAKNESLMMAKEEVLSRNRDKAELKAKKEAYKNAKREEYRAKLEAKLKAEMEAKYNAKLEAEIESKVKLQSKIENEAKYNAILKSEQQAKLIQEKEEALKNFEEAKFIAIKVAEQANEFQNKAKNAMDEVHELRKEIIELKEETTSEITDSESNENSEDIYYESHMGPAFLVKDMNSNKNLVQLNNQSPFIQGFQPVFQPVFQPGFHPGFHPGFQQVPNALMYNACNNYIGSQCNTNNMDLHHYDGHNLIPNMYVPELHNPNWEYPIQPYGTVYYD